MSRSAPHSLGLAWRVPFMLVVALVTAGFLSAVERPRAQALSGSIAVRVSGVDRTCAADLGRGLADLRQRLKRLRSALSRTDRAAWDSELHAFDQPLAGWELWPMLRAGGRVVLRDGAELFEWPATTAAALGLAELDPLTEPIEARRALEHAADTASGLSRAIGRLVAPAHESTTR